MSYFHDAGLKSQFAIVVAGKLEKFDRCQVSYYIQYIHQLMFYVARVCARAVHFQLHFLDDFQLL